MSLILGDCEQQGQMIFVATVELVFASALVLYLIVLRMQACVLVCCGAVFVVFYLATRLLMLCGVVDEDFWDDD